MIKMKEGRVCRFIFFQTLLCSGYIEGLSLHAASDLTKQSFTLVCDLEGASVSNPMSFTYNGTSAGGCSGPPGAACFSSIGTIAWSNQMVNFTLNQNEITSKGNALWTCTHGIDPASLTTTVIALCTNIEVKYADQKIDISCSCGFPSVQAEVNYKASQNGNSLGSQTFDLASSPGINCTTDNRAMDYSFKIENFPSGTAEVCATVKTYSQITTPTTICKPVPGFTTLSSTISSDMPATVSEVPPTPVTTSSAGLSKEMVITITISSSILALGVFILLIVLIVKQCRQKNRQTSEKSKGNRFATKQGNFSKKDDLKSSIKPRKSKFSGKRNTKQENISLDKFEHTQFNNSQAPKDRMYEHYPQTNDYTFWNNSANRHVFNHSHTERNMIKYGNRHDRYSKSLSGPTNRMLYQSCYPEHPRHNEGMFQHYRADKLYREQQMYQGPYVAQYDEYIKIKPENIRFEERTYERNWDFLY